jgi:putative PIG3 family NAD(P)H quinone oxidoreductase
MRAMEITTGNRLHPVELPEPVPAPGEVLIDVSAAGVNRADLAQVAGSYPPPPGASPLPGLEVAGRRRDTGQAVVALLAGGGYAEVVAVDEALVLPAPPGPDPTQAAGLVEVAATVVSNLVLEAGLRADETVLIHGGTGGIGSFAVQCAHALGARVLATVGSDAAVDTVRGLGADAAWNRHTTDLPAAVRDQGGADVVLDMVGGPALSDNVTMLRTGGRLVVIGTLGGARGELDLGRLMAKCARVIGTTLRSRPVGEKERILARTRELVWPMLTAGTVRVPIQATFPLAQAARAHQVLKAGGHLGKVVLTME